MGCNRLNKTQADFETLRDYNDYLETVEEITWNLILKIDLEATEKKLRLYEEAQKAERNPNATVRSYQPDPSLPSDTAQVILKKGASQRKVLGSSVGNTPDPSAGADSTDRNTGFSFRGLKKYVAPEPEKPIDPFDGWSVDPQYFVLQDDYDVEWLTKPKHDPAVVAGGYDIRDFYSQALCEAFSGFGVFVEEEINARETQASASGDTNSGTNSAAMAAVGGKDVNMDDVF